MKQLLLVIAIVICIKPIFPFMEYAFNYDYISKVLCINKDKPELNCNGKCYLMSKLAEESKSKEDNNKSIPLEHSFSLLFFEEIQEMYSPLHFSYNKQLAYSFDKNNYSFNFFVTLIKPPIL